MTYPTLDQADLTGKKVLLRAGFDVPLDNGEVQDTTRIEAMVPTMKHILDNGAALIIMAHQGRPKGEVDPSLSQKPLVLILEQLLGVSVQFAEEVMSNTTQELAVALQPGEVLLLENLRFHPDEKSKDDGARDAFGQQLAHLADIYVNDAFTNCHRDHASMTAVPRHIPGYLGLQAQKEVENLSKVLEAPARPVCLIVSGAKIETKVPVIKQFLANGDDILVGGCIANTLLAARGFDVGASKYDDDEEMMELARNLMLASEQEDKAFIHVPRDVIAADAPDNEAPMVDLPVEDIEGDMAIFDIGAVTSNRYAEIIAKAGTIVWNGPLGLYETEHFSYGSKKVAEAIAKATENGAISIIGGGDTLDLHERYGLSLDAYTFVSTAGGAMLDFISGKKLPALEALK